MAKKRKRVEIPGAFPIHVEGKGQVFTTVDKALSDPELSGQVVDYAICQIQDQFDYWGDLLKTMHNTFPTKTTEAAVVMVLTFEDVRKAHKKHWPTN